MKKLITHNGTFHTDDIFACATLSLLLEKKGETFEIIRTRDPLVIENGDFVFDVGGLYDPDKNRFDHHQLGLKPRENGIEYAAFGLVWKKFGTQLAEGEKETSLIEKKLVLPIDAFDNGQSLFESKLNADPYIIQNIFEGVMRPTWQEDESREDDMFFKSVTLAKKILEREITHAKGEISAEEKVLEDYEKAKDKRIIVLSEAYPCQSVLEKFSEPLFVIVQRKPDLLWGVKGIRVSKNSFKNRKYFPANWSGLRDEELQKVCGVDDAIFCHKGLFLAVAKSKEGAEKLAKLALEE